MPHECVKCGNVFGDADKEILSGCSCGSRFFFYIRQEKYDKLKEKSQEVRESLDKNQVKEMERDVRALMPKKFKSGETVVLDVETIRMTKPGKYEIDVMELFRGKPIIIKIAEGKYEIDVVSAFESAKKGTL
jgi:predicted  nucleic acid-binding Zn-ribbon protein